MNVPRKIVPKELGLGYDYDVCDAQALITRMQARDGRIVLPDGMSYAILTLQDQERMSLDVLRKIEQLVKQGATVVGPKPTRIHGLNEWSQRDAELRGLANRLWGACEDPGVKHFSGTASYGKTISLAESEVAQAAGMWIDPGDVRDVAEVFLNGQSLGVVWTPPYRVKVGAAAKAGENHLRVEVTNLWANRMIGDSKMPAAERFTRSNMSRKFSGDEELLPSGLLGSVLLLAK